MLKQTLQRLFENDETAASGGGSERIKANVLSRIESEKPMRKHIRIKPLIIAAVVSVMGIMLVVLTVNASVNSSTSAPTLWNDQTKEILLNAFDGDENQIKGIEALLRHTDIRTEYYQGKAAEARGSGEITIEKELDETDHVGYAEPYGIYFEGLIHDETNEFVQNKLVLIKQIEEDPASLGLVPTGKSETFEGGLRIVNRHFENTNEPVNGEKTYYSLRRVYTDDSENNLLASVYLGCEIGYLDPFDPENFKYPHCVLRVLIDHTKEGCVVGNTNTTDPAKTNYWTIFNETCNFGDIDDNFMGNYSLSFTDYYLKSLIDDKPITIGATIAVSSDGIQFMD